MGGQKTPDSKNNVSGIPASQKLQEAFWNTTHYIQEKITDFPDLHQKVSTATTKIKETLVNSFQDTSEKATSALGDLLVNNAVNRMVIEAMTQFERWKQHRQEEHRRMQEEKAQCINYCWTRVWWLGIAEWDFNAFNLEAARLMGWRFNQTTNTFEPRDCLEKCHSPDE